MDAIGFGWAASMWIKPDKNNPDDAVLMESPAGTLKLKQGKTGKLGFTKEHYNSTFNYVVPEDKWTHILLKGDDKGVSLFVNLDEQNTRHSGVRHQASPICEIPRREAGNRLRQFLLSKVNENAELHQLLLQVLNRYPYDANRPIDPMKTLIKQIEEY